VSYISQGLVGLVLSLVLLLFVIGVLLVLLLVFSVIMLAFGFSDIVPGTQPRRCGLWGHDWRRQIPLMAAGTTCRNCLVRKDGALIAWRAMPPLIPTVWAPNIGLFVPGNALNWGRKRPARAVILADDPRWPVFPLVPGAPLPFAPAPPTLGAAAAAAAAAGAAPSPTPMVVAKLREPPEGPAAPPASPP